VFEVDLGSCDGGLDFFVLFARLELGEEFGSRLMGLEEAEVCGSFICGTVGNEVFRILTSSSGLNQYAGSGIAAASNFSQKSATLWYALACARSVELLR
jgi:hypothetical protein